MDSSAYWDLGMRSSINGAGSTHTLIVPLFCVLCQHLIPTGEPAGCGLDGVEFNFFYACLLRVIGLIKTLHPNPPCRTQWPRGLRRRSTAARLLRSWVRIPPEARMFVYCGLSGTGLCDEPITRLRSVLPTVARRCVRSRNLV
jgi:hypothetical protein